MLLADQYRRFIAAHNELLCGTHFYWCTKQFCPHSAMITVWSHTICRTFCFFLLLSVASLVDSPPFSSANKAHWQPAPSCNTTNCGTTVGRPRVTVNFLGVQIDCLPAVTGTRIKLGGECDRFELNAYKNRCTGTVGIRLELLTVVKRSNQGKQTIGFARDGRRVVA